MLSFVRFLRPGVHNLSFELRADEGSKDVEWHCHGSNNVHVFDRILKRIHVEVGNGKGREGK